MKCKKKIKLVNFIIFAISLVVLAQSALLAINGLSGGPAPQLIEVSAMGDYAITKKEGLLNLLAGGVSTEVQEQIKIENQSDFVNVFNSYFENLKAKGGYSLKTNLIVTGTASTFNITAYQATKNIYEVDENGNTFSEAITFEVSAPGSTSTTGYGEISGKKVWVDQNGTKIQKTANVSCNNLGESNYDLSANYDGCEIQTVNDGRKATLLPFVVANDTISSFEYVENALTYSFKVKLNGKGYEQISKDAQEQASAVKPLEYKNFELNIIIDKWGNLISMQKIENFVITVKRVGMEIGSDTKSVSNYIVKRNEQNN